MLCVFVFSIRIFRLIMSCPHASRGDVLVQCKRELSVDSPFVFALAGALSALTTCPFILLLPLSSISVVACSR